MRILLTISYDGTKYYGWQRQKDKMTVQQRVEEALSELYNQEIEILGASRTDAGVHAMSQKATYSVIEPIIPVERITRAINHLLNDDVIITKCEEIGEEFHPQHSAKAKTYSYTILNSENQEPLLRNYTWNVKRNLDIEKMQEATKYFIGTHDFSSFRATGGQAKTTVRTIYDLKIHEEPTTFTKNMANVSYDNRKIVITVTGNGFLYNMVRIIAGTLMYVGNGKIKPCEIADIINSLDRKKAGVTAPPQGLCLMNIEY